MKKITNRVKIVHGQTKLNTALKIRAKNCSAIKKMHNANMHNDKATITKDNLQKPHNKTLSTQQMMVNMVNVDISNPKTDVQAKL